MDIGEMINRVKEHARSNEIGMIASHLGVVRGTARTGEAVSGIQVTYNRNLVVDIINDIKKLEGIVEVLVDYNEGQLGVGDEILAVVVGGCIREQVFPALMEAVNRIKAEAVQKKEF
jgi:molybdopterin synthase catalytic subunit